MLLELVLLLPPRPIVENKLATRENKPPWLVVAELACADCLPMLLQVQLCPDLCVRCRPFLVAPPRALPAIVDSEEFVNELER